MVILLWNFSHTLNLADFSAFVLPRHVDRRSLSHWASTSTFLRHNQRDAARRADSSAITETCNKTMMYAVLHFWFSCTSHLVTGLHPHGPHLQHSRQTIYSHVCQREEWRGAKYSVNGGNRERDGEYLPLSLLSAKHSVKFRIWGFFSHWQFGGGLRQSACTHWSTPGRWTVKQVQRKDTTLSDSLILTRNHFDIVAAPLTLAS